MRTRPVQMPLSVVWVEPEAEFRGVYFDPNPCPACGAGRRLSWLGHERTCDDDLAECVECGAAEWVLSEGWL
jgi:Zn ribbon nucleic-acid-binding protein